MYNAFFSGIVFLLVINEKHQLDVTCAGPTGPCIPNEQDKKRPSCQGVYPCDYTLNPPGCRCPEDDPYWNGTACRKAVVGEPCLHAFHCTSIKCEGRKCISTPDDPRSSYGGSCSDDGACITEKYLMCTNGKCSCNVGFRWENDICERIPKITFGGKCTENDDCIVERKLTCIKKKCGCEKGFVWGEAICKPKESQKKCNPDADTNECQKTSQQMECDKEEGTCRCPVNMEFSSTTQACKLKAGENCFINNTLQHDLCASQQCVKEAGSANPTCACQQNNNGVAETWSSEPGQRCVTDYFNFPCTRKGSFEECRPGTFNPSRNGLTCKDGLCQCEQGLTYSRGYCVIATLLFNEMCDPDGNGATCRGDAETSLTCQDIGGGDKRCVCLLREIAVREKIETVALTWNAAEKKCDLKPTGERCNGGYECRSGICRQTCQAPLNPPKGKSIRTVISASAFLVSFCSYAFTLKNLKF